MKANALQRKFIGAGIDFWGRIVYNYSFMLKDSFSDDENILAVSSCLKDKQSALIVVSDRKIVIGQFKGLKQNIHQYNFTMINTISTMRGFDISILFNVGEVRLKNVLKKRKVLETINEMMLKEKEADKGYISETSDSKDISDLRELKSLLDEQIITQEEFDIKKKQILNITNVINK